jgi:hypothetical protein
VSTEKGEEKGIDMGSEEDLTNDPSEIAANVPQDLDDFQPLPEELHDEEVGDLEYDVKDPESVRLATKKQVERDRRIEQARLNRALNALESEHSHLRSMAVGEMARIKDPRVPNALKGVATSDMVTAAERKNAAQELWHYAADQQFSDAGANQALNSLADSKDPSVQAIAKRALRDMERYQRRQGR